uniref:Uncharacterized protein n=1 Tax=Ascaris lumbricoides TaxID=6252 RepID=A0A0M3HJ94_ASCLU
MPIAITYPFNVSILVSKLNKFSPTTISFSIYIPYALNIRESLRGFSLFEGDRLIFTGDRKREDQSAIWLSSPIACQNTTGQLTFT